jgi:hypothetical protein
MLGITRVLNKELMVFIYSITGMNAVDDCYSGSIG